MTTLQASMSDLEDTVDTVEDSMTVLATENDEMQQRLTILEEAVIGMPIYLWLFVKAIKIELIFNRYCL